MSQNEKIRKIKTQIGLKSEYEVGLLLVQENSLQLFSMFEIPYNYMRVDELEEQCRRLFIF